MRLMRISFLTPYFVLLMASSSLVYYALGKRRNFLWVLLRLSLGLHLSQFTGFLVLPISGIILVICSYFPKCNLFQQSASSDICMHRSLPFFVKTLWALWLEAYFSFLVGQCLPLFQLSLLSRSLIGFYISPQWRLDTCCSNELLWRHSKRVLLWDFKEENGRWF